jgi:putative transposase
MKRSKFSEQQIAYALRQAESGTAVADVCRQLGVSEATFFNPCSEFPEHCLEPPGIPP